MEIQPQHQPEGMVIKDTGLQLQGLLQLVPHRVGMKETLPQQVDLVKHDLDPDQEVDIVLDSSSVSAMFKFCGGAEDVYKTQENEVEILVHPKEQSDGCCMQPQEAIPHEVDLVMQPHHQPLIGTETATRATTKGGGNGEAISKIVSAVEITSASAEFTSSQGKPIGMLAAPISRGGGG